MFQKRSIRRFSFILAMIFFALNLSACGVIIWHGPAESEPAETAGKPAAPTPGYTDYKKLAEENFKNLPAYSSGSMRTLIYAHDDDAFIGTGTESALNAARLERIEMLEGKYNTSIIFDTGSPDEIYATAVAARKNGDYLADMLLLPMESIGKFAAADLLYNLYALPYFDTGSSIFNQNSVAGASAGHRLLGISSDAIFEPEKIYCMYVNLDLLAKITSDDIYATVRGGKWTLDTFNSLSASAEALGFEKIHEAGTDVNFAELCLYTSGYTLVETGKDTVPTLHAYDESMRSFYSAASVSYRYFKSTDAAGADFRAGELLFVTDTVANADKYASAGFRWGVIPHPKGAEENGYATYTDGSLSMICLYAGTTNEVFMSHFITAISTMSDKFFPQDFIYNAIYTTLQDNNAAVCMDSIVKNVHYDLFRMIAKTNNETKAGTVDALESIICRGGDFDTAKKNYEEGIRDFLGKTFPVIYQ